MKSEEDTFHISSYILYCMNSIATKWFFAHCMERMGSSVEVENECGGDVITVPTNKTEPL